MDIGRTLDQLRQGMGAAHAAAREAVGQAQTASGKASLLDQKMSQMQRDINTLSDALSSLKASGGSGDTSIRYIEQIPGRRIPFDLLVNIPIGANIVAEQQASTQISQDGPFVAVARYCTFQSAYSFSQVDPETSASAAFQGRSYGRFRPTSSVGDLLDGSKGYQPVAGAAFPGLGAAIAASPSNHSNFRTMEFDGLIQFLNQGSGWQRQNIQVPSAFYMQEINSPFLLGALDFFERGETLQWKVTPTHTNNPEFGNVSGFLTGGFYPFQDSQYDVHEGIVDPYIQDQETDPITRLPNGILTIGFHGYRIIQPPGVVSMT
jgi:hypothetical protein